MKFNFRKNISFKINILMIFIIIVLFLIIGIVELQTSQKESDDSLNNDYEVVSTRLIETLRNPIWDLDEDTINNILIAELQNKNIHSIAVKDYQTDKLLAGKTRGTNWEVINWDERASDLFVGKRIEVLRDENSIAFIDLQLTDKFYRAEINSKMKELVVQTIALIIVFSLVLSFTILFIIIKPLKELTHTAKKIASGDLNVKASVASRDEVGVLGDTFNLMTGKLKKSQEQLKKQIIELQELDKLKDDFLNNTTHELKTPLIPIKSQTQLLLSDSYGKLSKKQRESIEMILRNEERLEALITDVMDVSKTNSKKIKFVFEKANLTDIVTEAVGNIKTVVDERKIKFILKPIPKLPSLSLDAKRIMQVLGNLLDNSIKFTPEGGSVTVEITKDEEKVTTTITDTGIGMSSKTLEKLFTPFFQADSDAARKYPGTGLGLSISKTLVEAHGGTIKGESKGEGKGSAISFTLPFSRKA